MKSGTHTQGPPHRGHASRGSSPTGSKSPKGGRRTPHARFSFKKIAGRFGFGRHGRRRSGITTLLWVLAGAIVLIVLLS